MDHRPGSEAVNPPPPAMPPAPQPPSRRGPWVIVLAIIATLVAAGIIVAIVSTSGSDGSADEPSPSSASADVEVAAPSDLQAQPSAFRVVLTWDRSEGTAPDGYTVYRDGETIGIAEGSEHRFVDSGAMPSSTYHYLVKAYAGELGIESKGTGTSVHTPDAPVAYARLQGVYQVRLSVSSSYGLNDVKANTGAWRFTPVCKTGPCRVRFGDLNGPIPNMELDQRSAVYDGQVSGPGGWECGGVSSTATLHIHLHIDEASAVNDQWRATKISGTYSVSISPQLGCRAGGATYAVRGVLHTEP